MFVKFTAVTRLGSVWKKVEKKDRMWQNFRGDLKWKV